MLQCLDRVQCVIIAASHGLSKVKMVVSVGTDMILGPNGSIQSVIQTLPESDKCVRKKINIIESFLGLFPSIYLAYVYITHNK